MKGKIEVIRRIRSEALSPEFSRASPRGRVISLFFCLPLPRWESVATLRSNKSVFPLQTTYAVALTLPSSLRYQRREVPKGGAKKKCLGNARVGDGKELLHYSRHRSSASLTPAGPPLLSLGPTFHSLAPITRL